MGKQGECRRCGHDSHVGRCMPVNPMTGKPVPGDPVCACEYEEREMVGNFALHCYRCKKVTDHHWTVQNTYQCAVCGKLREWGG